MKVRIEGDILTATVRDPEYGTATDTIAVEHHGGAETFGFTVNARYMTGITGLITADTATLSAGETGDPVLITEEGFGDRFIIMPIRG